MNNGPLTPDTAMAVMKAAQPDAASAADKLKSARKTRDMEAVTETAKEFEAMFVAEMMKPMFEGISTEPPFGGGKGEEVFRGLMLQEYGKMMAGTGQIGIADHVKQAIIQMQDPDHIIQPRTIEESITDDPAE